jgi:hypothetical protein
MISRASTNATIKQRNIHTKRDERFGWTTNGRLDFTAGLLDNSREDVFTAAYISQVATNVKEIAETTVKQDEKTGKVATTIQEVAYYNMFLTEAILELLAEKGILTGEEVLEQSRN